MSYDLYFDAESGKKLTRKTFATHFKGRANYQVGNGQAVYGNEDTAVQFIFDEPEDGMVAFNLNYFRPHVFGLEAAVELQAFADAFQTAVIDPQADEEEPGPFNREKFLQAWNAGNQFGYKAMLAEQESVHTWPAQKIHQVWEWNYGRPPESDWAIDDIFAPGIFAIEQNGQPLTVAIWPPGCPILLPEVAFLLVPVDQNQPENEDMALVRWDEVLPHIQPYQEQVAGLPRYRLPLESWPPSLTQFLGIKRPPVGQLNGVSLSEILDLEMVETVRRA